MLQVRWIILIACSLQSVLFATGAVREGPASTGASPPVVDWHQQLQLPDDILYVDHQTDKKFALIFLVSADANGRITSVRSISGFSLYLNRATEQIRNSAFAPDLNGKTFVVRIEDPLQALFDNGKIYRTEACTPDADLRKLYQVGELRKRQGYDIAASHCYKYILDRNPESVAARYGAAEVCISAKESCYQTYLQSVIASNPEFIEAREHIVQTPFRAENDLEYVADLDEILKLNIPLAERVALLNSQVFWLDRLDRIDDVVGVIKEWYEAVSELGAIYPPGVSWMYWDAMPYGLLEEAKGLNTDATASYRLASSIAASDTALPGSERYEIDLGLARTLRKSGNSDEAKVLCDHWSSRWRRMVSGRPRAKWERWKDGAGELEGRWEFSCGDPAKGLKLIEEAALKYPESDTPYTALSEYYYSIGEIEKARDAEATATRLRKEWDKRLGEF